MESGTWESRFFADNFIGRLYLCHTLRPNVSVDLTRPYGNAIVFSFDRKQFGEQTRNFEVYLHDPKEMVSLSTYKIANIPMVNFYKDSLKAKVQIHPSKFILEGHARDKCNDSQHYSRIKCDITQGWERRIQLVKETFGDRFSCLLPGKTYHLSKLNSTWIMTNNC